tara:strand:+ start:1502 stop:1711 length:210 start_codon:yes stop_codon:yes gene_type:complete
MKKELNGQKAIEFLLNQEYLRFKSAYLQLMETKPEEERKPCPDFEQYLIFNKILIQKSSIIQPPGLRKI